MPEKKTRQSIAGVVVAIMSTSALAGVGTGFFAYLQHRETIKIESRKIELQAAYSVKDLELQIAAMTDIITEQGKQLIAFKAVLEKLTREKSDDANKLVGAIDIPITQGIRVLRGRSLPSYESIAIEKQRIADAISKLGK